jgi:hypothetical protein
MQSLKLSILLIVVCSAVAEGQRRSGSGISGGFGPSSSFDYVRVHWGPPDSTQLVAAIFFKGSTEWGSLAPHERDWAERTSDSASRAAQARGRRAGGSITPRATAWVEYDDRNGIIVVLDREWLVPRRDSALVLLVDRIDGVGGDPTAEAVMVRVSPLAERQHGEAGVPPSDFMDAIYTHWNNALRSNPKVRSFIDSMK